jgi:hypothetical protein
MLRDKDGRLKRIEYRGKHLRASRTGGVSLRAQTKAAGMNLTVNTNHGVRVSKRVAIGTDIGLQNGRFVLRGRYGKGPIKLNLSKSGVSMSSKTSVGTINWFKPRYSSAKIAGIQVRGKNAIYINAIVAIFKLVSILGSVVIQLLAWMGQVLLWVPKKLFYPVEERLAQRKAIRIQTVEDAWIASWEDQEPTTVFAGMTHLLFQVATGKNDPHPNFMEELFSDEWTGVLELDHHSEHAATCEQSAVELTENLLAKGGLPPLLLLETAFGSLVGVFADNVDEHILLDTFLLFDETIVEEGTRNQLQESLLAVFSYTAGIETTGGSVAEAGSEGSEIWSAPISAE